MGLRKEVKSILASVSHTQYGQVVEVAIRTERSLGLAPQISQGLSRPDSRPDPIGGSEPSSRCETHDWDSLPDFFFFKPNWYLWVWPTLIIIQNIIYKSKELPPE